MSKLRLKAINTATKHKLKFASLKPGNYVDKFLRAAMKICPSNLLLSTLTGISASYLSTFRGRFAKEETGILEAQPLGIVNAYNLHIKPLLQLAETMKVKLNHRGYYTAEDLALRSATPIQVTEAKKKSNPVVKKEKIILPDVFQTLQAGKSAGAKEATVNGVTFKF